MIKYITWQSGLGTQMIKLMTCSYTLGINTVQKKMTDKSSTFVLEVKY